MKVLDTSVQFGYVRKGFFFEGWVGGERWVLIHQNKVNLREVVICGAIAWKLTAFASNVEETAIESDEYLFDRAFLLFLLQVWTLVIAYVLVVIFYWTPDSSRVLRVLAIPVKSRPALSVLKLAIRNRAHEKLRVNNNFVCFQVWVALLLHLASIAGPLRVPLVVIMVALMAVGFVTEIGKERRKESGTKIQEW